MTVRKGAVAGLALLVPALVGLWLVKRHPTPPAVSTHVSPAAVAAVAQDRNAGAPAAGSLVQARQVHDQLLAEAEALPTPNSLPLPDPPAMAVTEQPIPQPLPNDVPLERQVTIGFTGNVVGETDPCG